MLWFTGFKGVVLSFTALATAESRRRTFSRLLWVNIIVFKEDISRKCSPVQVVSF
jgi:hypothetical protein